MAHVIISNYDDEKNPYYGGGSALAVHEIAKRLAQWHTVTVYASKYPRCVPVEVRDGVQYRRVGVSRGALLSQIAFQLAIFFPALFSRYDVWIESFSAPFGVSAIPLLTARPVIGLTHFPGAPEMVKKYHVRFDIVEHAGMRWYQYCIALSEQIKERLHNLAPKMKITVIPNGVQSEYFEQPVGKKEQTYFLFLGRIDIVQKGLDLLVAAYSLDTGKSLPPLKIAGDGVASDVQQLKTLLVEKGLESRAQLLGRVSGQQKVSLIQGASAILMPSRSENHSMVALEALALGVPLLCFDIDGFHWLPQEFCYKVPAFDVQKLSECLHYMATHETEIIERAAAARDFAKQFSWDNAAEMYNDFVQSVLRK